jgi:hypothetical protein
MFYQIVIFLVFVQGLQAQNGKFFKKNPQV